MVSLLQKEARYFRFRDAIKTDNILKSQDKIVLKNSKIIYDLL